MTTTKASSSSSSKNPVVAKWHAFLLKSHKTMVSQLCERVKLGRHASIRCLWGVIAGSPTTRYHVTTTTHNHLKQSTTLLLQSY